MGIRPKCSQKEYLCTFMAVDPYTHCTQINIKMCSYIHPMTVQQDIMIIQIHVTMEIMIEFSVTSIAFQGINTWAWVI